MSTEVHSTHIKESPWGKHKIRLVHNSINYQWVARVMGWGGGGTVLRCGHTRVQRAGGRN